MVLDECNAHAILMVRHLDGYKQSFLDSKAAKMI